MARGNGTVACTKLVRKLQIKGRRVNPGRRDERLARLPGGRPGRAVRPEALQPSMLPGWRGRTGVERIVRIQDGSAHDMNCYRKGIDNGITAFIDHRGRNAVRAAIHIL